MALIILKQILIMALYMLLGCLLYKKGKITEEGSKSIANLLAFLVIPMMLVNSFLVEYSPEKAQHLLISLGLGVLSLAVSILIARILFPNSGVECFAAAFSNAGFIGIPLISSVYGDEGVFFLVGLLMPYNVLQWNYGGWLLRRDVERAAAKAKEFAGATSAGDSAGGASASAPAASNTSGNNGHSTSNVASKNSGLAAAVKQVLLSPIIIASICGMIIFFSGLGSKVPYVVTGCVSGVASINAPLAMIVLGVYLAQADVRELLTNPRLYWISFVRLIIIPIAIVLVFALIPAPTPIRMTMIIAGAAPVAANAAVYSQIFGGDYVYGCKTVTQSTLLSIISLPLIVMFADFIIH